MEQYKFSLQKLLDIRTDKEEKSKQVFVEAQRQKQLVQDKLNNLKANYEKHKVFNKNESIVEQKIKNNYLYALNIGINETSSELARQSKTVEEKRELLNQDQIERKTVEILKEKKQFAYIKEQNRIEQVNNDEFALYSFIRNRRGGE